AVCLVASQSQTAEVERRVQTRCLLLVEEMVGRLAREDAHGLAAAGGVAVHDLVGERADERLHAIFRPATPVFLRRARTLEPQRFSSGRPLRFGRIPSMPWARIERTSVAVSGDSVRMRSRVLSRK